MTGMQSRAQFEVRLPLTEADMFAKGSMLVGAVTLCLILVVAAVARAEITLGASSGYTHVSYTSSDLRNLKNDIFGIPGTGDGFQPGFRVGYVEPRHHWELNTDVTAE